MSSFESNISVSVQQIPQCEQRIIVVSERDISAFIFGLEDFWAYVKIMFLFSISAYAMLRRGIFVVR